MIDVHAYSTKDRPVIRIILQKISWSEQYILACENMGIQFSQDEARFAGYCANYEGQPAGFVFVEYHAWNTLAQIQGLAVDPDLHRRGIARELVQRGVAFARSKNARGVYVDTPTKNGRGRAFYEAIGFQRAYIMPRYYEDQLDGVTYQHFFNPA